MITTLLITSPLLFALLVLVGKRALRESLSIIFVLFLVALSIYSFVSHSESVEFVLSHTFHTLFVLLDILVILYFLWQGFIKKDSLVKLFALLQLALFIFVLFLLPSLSSSDIYVDRLSTIMYLVINIVGGIIIVYALGYIRSEEFSTFKKNAFIAMLFFFLSVMNFIVSTNNIEIFFLLFELTTLCSYLLIAYRADEISNKNALLALWMNQIGGVAILIALMGSILFYDTLHLDLLLESMDANFLLPLVLLAIAAFVKAASIPFDRWLLGAMVAPTPVSAILHSATMVKIAPYLMLKLAPAMSGFVSITITIIGTSVFFFASLFALSKDYFKEILGLSTIALLGLMIALAAIGSAESIMACITLIVFHAISKALLFFQAGILEKQNHLKYVKDIDGLINHSPMVVFFIVIGFASLTLPPFGVFIAKFMAIESIAMQLKQNPLFVLALIFIAMGSVFLTLLYFKVLTKLFAKDVDAKRSEEELPKLMFIPSALLVSLLIIGVIVSLKLELLNSFEIIVPSLLIAIVPLLFATLLFKNAHRVKEYHCGEKDELSVSMYYFEVAKKYRAYINIALIALMLTLIVGTLL